ncbi:hypothetical protein C8R44DRAFT_870701 [Mycena epipterygia]|nr:hypothetical protein C8R44DRAFT_870701 [Mycena epipterygia]
MDILKLPNLKKLQFFDCSVWGAPSVVSFSISSNTRNTLNALISQPAYDSGDLVLPRLRKLILAGSYLFSTNLLLQMLESRLSASSLCTALAFVEITLDREIRLSDLQRFAALRDAGFVNLTCRDGDKKPVRICNGHCMIQSSFVVWYIPDHALD